MAGITLTAVVFELTIPMAASSAIMPAITSAGVSPGIAIISSPTEHTAVIASSFSIVSTLLLAASIIPASSETGINAPESPPTWLDAITPPFLTASLRSARQAVVPHAPQLSSPISSSIWATESPTAGVGASDRSTIPKGTPSLSEATDATSCPTLVILNAVFLTVSATSVMFASGIFASAALTTPGPDTPTFITQSGSPAPWKAPAINGLSSGALQKTTSFEGPTRPLSCVFIEASRTISPISATASIFMPAFVEPMFTLEQTLSVTASASGMLFISSSSPFAKPLCTSAE